MSFAGPYKLFGVALTGVYRSFCSARDNGGSPSGGFSTTVAWTVGGVTASVGTPKFSPMAFNAQGTGTFTTTTWAAGANPQGADGYIIIDEPISATYPSSNWSVSFDVKAAVATASGTGHLELRVYTSPNAGGQTSTSSDNWTEITSGSVSTTSWSNLTTSANQTLTATFNPGALDLNGKTICFRLQQVLTATSSGTTAQVTIVNGTITPPTPTVKAVGRISTAAQASGFTFPNYPITLTGPTNTGFVAGDTWYFGILRVQTTPNDVTAVTESHSGSITQKVKDSFSDSNGNLTDIWSGVITTPVASITINATLAAVDNGQIVEIQSAIYRNFTGAGSIIVDATFNHGNAPGSPEATFAGSFTLTGAPAIIYQYATGQSGNWAPDPTATIPDTSYLVDQCAANTDQYENFVSAPGTYNLAYKQTGTNGTGIHMLSLFVSVPVTGAATQRLSGLSQSALGAELFAGAATQNLIGLGQATAAAETFASTASQPLSPVAQSAAGAETFVGGATQALIPLAQLAAGGSAISGPASQQLGAFVQAAAGGEAIGGSAAQALSAVVQSATGAVSGIPAGGGAQSLGALSQAAVGAVSYVGVVVQALPSLAQLASGSAAISGAAVQALAGLSQVSTASEAFPGAAAQRLLGWAQAAAGAEAVGGAAAQQLPALVQLASSVPPGPVGPAAQSLGALAQIAVGVVSPPGPLTLTLSDQALLMIQITTLLSEYEVGQAVRFQSQITSLGVLTDSDTLSCTISLPDGTILTPAVVRESQGIYHADAIIAGSPALAIEGGIAIERWVATGPFVDQNANVKRRFTVARRAP